VIPSSIGLLHRPIVEQGHFESKRGGVRLDTFGRIAAIEVCAVAAKREGSVVAKECRRRGRGAE
jgi:hypothetical protein